MYEKSANVETAATGQSNEAGQQLFTTYEQHDRSPVLTWLPILLGLMASAVVALALCPAPRSPTLSPAGGLFLAVAYILATVGIGGAVLVACGVIVARRKREVPIWWAFTLFCGVAAWMTPVVAFYARDSLWSVSAGFVLSILGSRLIYRYHLATGAGEMFSADAESTKTDLSHATRRTSLTLAALLLQLGVLFVVASMARPATVLIGGAIIVISFFHQPANRSEWEPRFPKTRSLSITLGLAMIMVAASLTPYLAVETGDTDAQASGHSTAKPTDSSAKANASLAQSAGSWFRRFLTHNPQSGSQDKRIGGGSSYRPYPALQALFGEGNTATGPESGSGKKKLNTGKPTVLVPGDSEPGVILRPKITEDVKVVPPSPTRRVFEGGPNDRTTDPVSIPFYGAYWLFRASDRTLPTGAVEMRGDTASTSFKTTDFSPITMEAHQNFGSVIELSCCRAIELVISNADRRPGTVVVELILTDSTHPGQSNQSLGIKPVNSTQRWFPGDDRPPAKEVLTFPVPAHLAIQRFDAATIRFELRSPREPWSAKIAIEKFRLIPRGL